jgi:hypothetical protein
MPCYDERSSPSYLDAEFAKERRRLQDKLNLVTRLLCSLCKELTRQGVAGYISKIHGLDKWWEEHQAADRRHEREELERKHAIRQKKIADLKKLANELNLDHTIDLTKLK